MGAKARPTKERFEEKFIKQENDCWIWLAGKDKDGYGLFWLNNKQERAHRVSYRLYKGDFDNDLLICHTCDTPSCVNYNHLFVGTEKDNAQDASNKGRLFNQINKKPHPSMLFYRKGCRCDECVELFRETIALYRNKNKDKINEYGRNLYEKNKERKLAKQKEKYHRLKAEKLAQ